MFEFINGHFIDRDPNGVMTLYNERNGVGYQIHSLIRDWQNIDEMTGEVRVFVRAVFNETTGYTLYGFESPVDRRAFDVIRKAQGVGGKLAVTILSQLTVGDLATATVETFKPIKGVGPKVAAKIIPELGALHDLVASQRDPVADAEICDEKTEAVTALVSLGYPRDKALKAVHAVSDAHPESPSSTLVRLATGLLHR